MNNPHCLEKYDDFSNRLELAALACIRKHEQDSADYTDQETENIAAEDIANGIESYFYECMVDKDCRCIHS